MDSKQMLEKACRLMEPEIEKLLNQPALDNQSLEKLHLLSDTKKNFMKIHKLEMETMGYSNGYSNHYPQQPMFYAGASSHYPGPVYDDGYSRGTDTTRDHLEMAMRNARDERTREEIRQLLTRM